MNMKKFMQAFLDKKYLSSVILRFFIAILSLIFIATISNLLPSQEAAAFFFAYAASNIIISVSKLGFDQFLTRSISADSKSSTLSPLINGAKISCLSAGVFFSLIAFISFFFISNDFIENHLTSLLLIIFSSIPGVLCFISAHILQGKSKPKLFLWFQAAMSQMIFLINLFIAYRLLGLPLQLEVFSGIYFFSCIISYLTSLIFIKQIDKNLIIGNFAIRLEHLNVEVRNLYIGSIMISLLMWGGPIIMAIAGFSDEIVYMNISQKLAGTVVLVVSAFNAILFPVLSKSFANNDINSLINESKKATRLMVCICLPILVTIYASKYALFSLFGISFLPDNYFFEIFLIAQLFDVMAGPILGILMMTKMHAKFMVASMFGALIFFTLAGMASFLGPISIPIAYLFAVIGMFGVGGYYVYEKYRFIPIFGKIS